MTYLGIDVGGTRIKAGRVSSTGEILEQKETPTPSNLTDFRAALEQLIQPLCRAPELPAGVGVGCKGIINPATTRVETQPGNLFFLEGSTLSDLIAPSVGPGIPVHADNDARVALVGEVAWGAARQRQNVLMLTLGTGVGGGAMSDGRILRGATGVAGHLGHVTVDVDGPECICGNYGCLETFSSARTIEAEAFSHVHRGCESGLTRAFHEHPERITCKAVFELAEGGDKSAQLIVQRAIRKLGAALAGLAHVFDPELIILGGQVAEAGDALFQPIRKEVAWRSRRLLNREVPIVRPQVADASGVVGAAALALLTQEGKVGESAGQAASGRTEQG